jgi:uncharacterized membrane protein YfhO
MKKAKNYLLSFIIPIIVMIILYTLVGVIGGNKNILTVDLANQYVEFFSAFKNVLNGTISPFYSFSKTLGGNLFGLITYYLMSPFNLLIIFFNRIDIPKFVLIINILKIGASGLTSYIFFNKTFKKENTSLAFSITYSLMAYNIVYSQNLLWLDGVIMLPLIFLGIDKMIEKKPLLFYITLTLSIIFNYYIGYMSCIVSLIYYTYQSYLKEEKIKKEEILYCIKYILISVLTSGIILIPSLFSLLQGKANGMLGDFVPNQKFALLDLITRFYIGTFKNSDILGTLPNVYISVMMTFLVIYYFFNKNINKKEKQASLILIGVFTLGFVFSPINTIWHTFKNPVGFPFRYSFMFDFILLIIAYKSLLKIKEIDKNFIKKFLLYTTLLTLLIDKLLYTKSMYYKIIGTLVLMTIYIFYLSKKKNKELSKLIILLITLEMTINGGITVYNIKYQNKEKYNKFVTQTGSIIDNINKKENTLYRLEKDYSYSSNDQLLLNYNGLSHFSSTYEGNINEFLGKYLGIFNRFYVTNYYGSTLVTNSLLNIKYLLSEKELDYYKKIESNYNINTYQNNYNLPIGFMVNKDIQNIKLEEYNPFENQNNILKTMDKNIEDVFEKNTYEMELNNLKLDENEMKPTYKKKNKEDKASIKIKITTQHAGILYGYMSCSKYKKVDVLLNGKSIIDITDENGYQCNILELGNYEPNETIELEFQLLEEEIKPKDFMFYTLDINKFEKATNILKQHNELRIIEYSKDYIRTNINVQKQNEILYTSIPYDKGMTVLVDGKKSNQVRIFDTFIGIELQRGNHIIEFKYKPRGFKEGIEISIIGIGLFVLTEIKKKKTSN